jgi:hypothetical protein
MKLESHFEEFLTGTVNLNQSRIDILDARLQAVESFLNGHETFSELIAEDLIPQGSYAHKTIIKPVAGHDFDVDVLVPTHTREDFEPSDYIAELYSALRSSGTYHDMTSRRTRCVTIQYAKEFHIDLVPYLERDGNHWIVNRHDNTYELSNPERFNEWLDERNRDADLHLVPVIRLLKYLRDFKQTFSCKSIILTTLLGNQVHGAYILGDPSYYSDVPSALMHVLTDLDVYLQATPLLPVILDPGGTGDDFAQRWDQDQYTNFRTRVHRYCEKVTEAYEESDEAASLAQWQDLFGTGFRAPPATTITLSESKAASASSEQFLDRDYGIQTRLTGEKLRIVGRLNKSKGFREYALAQAGNRAPKGRSITFRIIHCDVAPPYQVYWKVQNRGEEAANVGQLRGEIRRDEGQQRKIESTRYHGSHFVECFIVKDGVCVASDRQQVYIT